LQDGIEGFEGDQQLFIPKLNWVIWAGLSIEAFDAITALLKEKKIEYGQASFYVVITDIHMLTLPIVKRAQRYKKPRWFPVTLSVAAQCNRKESKMKY